VEALSPMRIIATLEFREGGNKDRVSKQTITIHVIGTRFTSMVFQVIWFSI
jgi:hypothetical protein